MFNVLPPSPFCFALEPFQAMRDYVAGHVQLRDLSLQGDGHPVLVFPGLGLSGSATADLRVRLQQLGYAVYDWNHGFNHGPGLDFDAWLSLLSRQLQEIHARHGVVRQHQIPFFLQGGIEFGIAVDMSALGRNAVLMEISLDQQEVGFDVFDDEDFQTGSSMNITDS